jgi:hypothetical protein
MKKYKNFIKIIFSIIEMNFFPDTKITQQITIFNFHLNIGS